MLAPKAYHGRRGPDALLTLKTAWADGTRHLVFEPLTLLEKLAALTPRCGGRLRLIATVEDPDAIRAILTALAMARERTDRAPPFAPSLNTSHPAAIGA